FFQVCSGMVLVRDILNGSYVLRLSIPIARCMNDCPQVLDRVVRHYQTPVPFKLVAVAMRLLDHFDFLDQTDVFRMDTSTDQFGRHGHTDLKFVDAIELFGPCNFVSRYIPRKTASQAEALTLCEKYLAAPQLVLRPLAFANVPYCSRDERTF